MSKSFILLNAVVIFVMVLSVVLMIHNNQQNKPTATHQTQLIAYMSSVNYTTYDQHGNIHSHIIADTLHHYSNNITYFTYPTITMKHSGGTKIWLIHAAFGQNNIQQHRIFLRKNVVVHEISKTQPTLTIHTQQLTIWPKQHQANTNSYVTIQRPGVTISGNGLVTNFQTGNTTILSHVRSYYVPSTHYSNLSRSINLQ